MAPSSRGRAGYGIPGEYRGREVASNAGASGQVERPAGEPAGGAFGCAYNLPLCTDG